MKVFEICEIRPKHKCTRIGALYSSLDVFFETGLGRVTLSRIERDCKPDGILRAAPGECAKDYILRCLDACPGQHVYFKHDAEDGGLADLLGGHDESYLIDFFAIEVL